MRTDTVIVKIMSEIVADMKVQGIPDVTFMPGRSSQISKYIRDIDNSETQKNNKYPLLAMLMPVREKISNIGITATFRRISIATINTTEDDVLDRYADGGTFQSILYPLFNEFFNAIARCPYVLGQDPQMYEYGGKEDFPGVKPTGFGITDFVDFIEISDLQLTFQTINTCKK